MRITSKTRYAVTALLDLALHEGSVRVRLPDIAERHGISLSYLEQLFAKLRRKGVVQSVRGRGGGYRLGSPADRISIVTIVDAMNEGIDTTRCRGKGNCQQGQTCLSHHLWTDLSGHIHEFLEGITLADLIAREQARDGQPAVSDEFLASGDNGNTESRIPVRNA